MKKSTTNFSFKFSAETSLNASPNDFKLKEMMRKYLNFSSVWKEWPTCLV